MLFRLFIALFSVFGPTPAVDSCVRYWQQQLLLADWRVNVRVADRSELEEGTEGGIEADVDHKRATIFVLKESESDLPPRQARADQCVTIAHEMVHLSRLKAGDAQWQDETTTVARTFELLQKHRRWRELSVAEP